MFIKEAAETILEKIASSRASREFWKLSDVARSKILESGALKDRRSYSKGIELGNKNIIKKMGIKESITSNPTSYNVENRVINTEANSKDGLERAVSRRHEIFEAIENDRISKGRYKGGTVGSSSAKGGYIAYGRQPMTKGDHLELMKLRKNVNESEFSYDLKSSVANKVINKNRDDLYGKVESLLDNTSEAGEEAYQKILSIKKVAPIGAAAYSHANFGVLARESNLVNRLPHSSSLHEYRTSGPVSEAGIVKSLFGGAEYRRDRIKNIDKHLKRKVDHGNIHKDLTAGSKKYVGDNGERVVSVEPTNVFTSF